MTEENSYYDELKSCFNRLKNQLKKYREGTMEYKLILEDLDSVYTELYKSQDKSKTEVKDDSEIGKSKTR